MNKIFSQSATFVLTLTTFSCISNGLPAQGQTMNSAIDNGFTQPMVIQTPAEKVTPMVRENVEVNHPVMTNTFSETRIPIQPTQIPVSHPSNLQASEALVKMNRGVPSEQPVMKTGESLKTQSVHATPQTSARALTERTVVDQSAIAQLEYDPEQTKHGHYSYIGIGGNIGVAGQTALSDFGFAIFSKIGLTRNISFRPSAVFSSEADFLLPITYDFPITAEPFERINFLPYVGAGVMFSTENDNNVGFLLTGGVDLPLSKQFTATAGVNVGFSNEVNVGITLGIGYNFLSPF